MASRRGNVRVSITADADGVRRGTRDAEQALGRFERSSASTAKRVAGAFAAAFAIDRIAGFAAETVKASSDVNEALTKNQRLFGAHAKSVEQFANQAASAFGISKRSALEYTGVFGNLARAQGVADGASAKMSVRLTQLAADLASFNNTGIEDALDALRSGLVGETEPLRRFGVALSAAAVQAEAARAGIVKVDKASADYRTRLVAVQKAEVARGEALRKYGPDSLQVADANAKLGKAQEALAKATAGANQQLTPQQKILATQSLIFRQTAQAQGDFERTQGGMANQSRKLAAQIDNLKVKIGDLLLPTALKVTKVLVKFTEEIQSGTGQGGRFADKVKEIAEKVKNAVTPFANLAAGIGKLVGSNPALVQMAANIAAVGLAIKGLKFAGAITGMNEFVKVGRTMGQRTGNAAAASTAATFASQTPGAMSGTKGKLESSMSRTGKWMGRAAGIGLVAALISELQNSRGDVEGVVRTLVPLQPGSAPNTPRGYQPHPGDPPYRRDRGPLRLTPPAMGITRGRSAPGSSLVLERLSRTPYKAATGGIATSKDLIGTPGTGTHTLGNWQSDNAVDISISVGSPITAVESGKIRKVSIKPSGGGRFAGSSVTLDGESGNSYFYAHLSAVNVKAGQKVRSGQVIGRSGSANGTPHLHFATESGDPRSLRLPNGGGLAITKLNSQQRTIYAAAKKYGIDPAILWGLYGAETDFGRNVKTSPKGARGPFQIMPDTARELGIDPNNFEEAAYGAARYLARYKGRGTRGMLQAYNAGPNGNPNNQETRAYVAEVLGLAGRFPTVGDDGLDLVATDPREVARQIAARRILPIARRLRSGLSGAVRGIGIADRRITRYGDTISVLDAQLGTYDTSTNAGGRAAFRDLQAKRDAMFAAAKAKEDKRRDLLAAARKYSSAIKSLKAKLKSAPRLQRSTIRAQLKRYQARLREIQTEARQLRVQVQIDAADLRETIEEIGALDRQLQPNWTGVWESNLETQMMLAEVGGDSGRMMTLAGKQVDFYQGMYQDAVRRGDVQAQIDYGQRLQGARDRLSSLTPDPNAVVAANAAAVVDAITMVDLEERAGGISKEEADARRKAIRESALAGGYGQLSPRDWLAVKGDLKESLEALTQAVEDNTKAQLAVEKERADRFERAYRVSQGESGAIGRALIDWMSGELGGRVGLGFNTPSFAGGGSRY